MVSKLGEQTWDVKVSVNVSQKQNPSRISTPILIHTQAKACHRNEKPEKISKYIDDRLKEDHMHQGYSREQTETNARRGYGIV